MSEYFGDITRKIYLDITAPSTQVLLGGKTPGEVGAALQDQRVKQKLVHEVKMDEYPAGLDAAGQWF